jgi:hypothetical protein
LSGQFLRCISQELGRTAPKARYYFLFLLLGFRNLTPAPPPFSSMNSTPAASKVRQARNHDSFMLLSVRSVLSFFWLISGVLSKTHARDTTVLVDELDAGGF